MKKLIEGSQLLEKVPMDCRVVGREPIVKLNHGLTLDDGNCFQSPTLILGQVGSGKSTLLKKITEPILDYAEKSGDNVVIFCAKPELLAYRRQGDIVISADGKEPECCWNIFEELKTSQNPDMLIRETAHSLFDNVTKQTNQPFFPQAASDIFQRTCLYLNDFGIKNGLSPTNADLVEFLETTPVFSSDKTTGWLSLAEMSPEYFSPLRDYLGSGGEQAMGVLSELRTLISRMFYGSFASEGSMSVTRLIREGGKRIFLYYNYVTARSTLPILKLILDLILKEGMNPELKHKTWVFMDEGSLLPKSDVLIDALSLGRDPGSNGGGLRLFMCLQSAELMKRNYPDGREAEILLSLFPNVISLKVYDPMSRKIISERYGKAHYQLTYVGVGQKITETDSYEEVVGDWQFSRIDKKGMAIVSMPGISDSAFIYDGYEKEGGNA